MPTMRNGGGPVNRPEPDPVAMSARYPGYDNAMARTPASLMPKFSKRVYDWTRETTNYQVFEEARTDKWNGVLYLPNDILRVGRAFGRIEVITGAREKHACNCPNCNITGK